MARPVRHQRFDLTDPPHPRRGDAAPALEPLSSSQLRLERVVFRGQKSEIHAAVAPDGAPLIVKLLRRGEQSVVNLMQLRREYEFLRSLEDQAVRRARGLVEIDGVAALVLEDVAAVTLSELCQAKLSLHRRVRLAARWAKALAGIHVAGVVHRDVNPNNVLVSPADDRVYLIDFGIAVELTRSQAALPPTTIIEGTMAYLAPEQTGRTAQLIDERCDLYGLGASLYEVFTGTPPFPGKEGIELIHAHLTQQPRPLQELSPELPECLSRLVLKLLAKDPVGRYRGALGVAHDLEAVAALLERGDKTALGAFELGLVDLPLRLAIPKKLYGRENQQSRLRQEWDYVLSGGNALVLLRGPAGAGKTALLKSLASSDLYRRAHVASGKYELLGRDTPYDGIIQAALALIHGMQATSEAALRQWLGRLTAALGVNAGALTDIIPELSDLIGPQAAPPEVAPIAAKNRLEQSFLKFFCTFAEASRPLVLFLDDIQWADAASLELIRQIAEGPHGHILLVAACRDDELDAKHALALHLPAWEQELARYCSIQLTPMDEEAVNELCRDTLHWSVVEAGPLAAVLHQRTKGNPFFVNQLLQGLYRDGILTFALASQCWEVDLNRLQVMPQSDQVTTLLTGRLRELPEAVQRVLSCAAFYGHKFDAQTLAVALLTPTVEVEAALSIALSEELILRSYGSDPAVESKAASGGGYQFLHDRVIEACQGLLPPADALAQRLALARILIGGRTTLKGLTPSEAAPIFHALYHFTAAKALVIDAAERLGLARLYADAGERAQAATAWDIGAELFHHGSSFAPEGGEGEHRALRRRLQYGEGSCAMLAGDSETADQRFAALLSDAATPHEVAEVQYVRCRLYTSMERSLDAIEAGTAGLRALGVATPSPRISKARAFSMVTQRVNRIDALTVDHILQLPLISEPDKLLVIALFTETIHPCLLANSELGIALVCLQIDYLLAHGHSPYSAVPFLYLAVSINGVIAYLATALWKGESLKKILQVHRQLAEKFSEEGRGLQNEMVFRAYSAHLHANFREVGLGIFPLVGRLMERGDLVFSGYSMLFAVNTAWFVGQNLISVQSSSEPWSEFIPQHSRSTRDSITLYRACNRQMIEGNRQTILETLDRPDPGTLRTRDQLSYHCAMLAHEGMIATLLGDGLRAYEALRKSFRFGLTRTFAGSARVIVACMFFTLAIAMIYPAASRWKRPWLLLQMAWARRVLGVFGKIAPGFSRHKRLFADALWCQTQGKRLDRANALLESAMQLARQEGVILDEALIAEYLGRRLLAQELPQQASGPLLVASAAYERGGMLAKVREIDELIRGLPTQALRFESAVAAATASAKSTSGQESSALDAPTMIRAAYTLSREINLTDLKTTLLQLLIETAGARHAALLWRPKEADPSKTPLQVVAHRTADGATSVEALPPSDGLVSLRAIAYVERTHKALILGDVSTDVHWQDDPSLGARQVKSLLCIPIMAGGVHNGAIYLENDLLAHTFTEGRVKILTVLAGQLAISLDNAMLYTKLSDALVAERTARTQEQASHAAYIAAEEARRHLQAGLEAAEAVQKSLVNVKAASSEYRIDYLYDPAENTGGDWLSSYVDERHGWLYLCLGDVTGHGVPAALVTAAVAGAIASWVTRLTQSDVDLPTALSTIATAANTAVLATGGPTEQLMTLALIGIKLATGEASYLNAGHPPILCVGGGTEVMLQSGNPLGFSAVEHFGRQDFTLEPNDMLVLFSDGLTENRDAQGQHLKLRALRRLIGEAGSPEAVIAKVGAYVASLPRDAQRDDTACMAVQWLGAAAAGKGSGQGR
jgi:predicted ATPase/serine phosphatase RsbU (regulator of sigma subunit)